MQLFWTIVAFILGSMIGSFLNVCIYRLPRDRSPWYPRRSYCPHCHEVIPWHDNVPLASYFLLQAQCRHCGSHISARYVLVEFLTAAVFALTYSIMSGRSETLPVIVVYLALMALLIMASFIDVELRIIPNSLTIGGMLLAPALSVLIPQLHEQPAFARKFMLSPDPVYGSLSACFIGMAIGAASTWLAGVMGKHLFRREAMGFGDVKFMALLGGFLGWQQVLLIFFMAPVLGSVVGLIHLIRTKEHHIPYGPFLSIAAAVSMLWADKIFRAIGLTG